MTQNMFQEGLYQVFFKDRPPGHSSSQATAQGELVNVRIHRWFSTVVNTRLLVAGVRFCPHRLNSVQACELPICFTLCVSPSGGADDQRLRLHTNHGHPCVRELQLRRLHDNASVVKPLCELHICRYADVLDRENETLLVVFQYVAAGCQAVEVQRKASRVKVNTLNDHF